MKTLIALVLLLALPLTLRAETISEYEKKFDVVLGCGPDALSVGSCKKEFNALFDKTRWSIAQIADFAKLHQVAWIGLKLQTNMIEDDAIRDAQALFAKSGAHVTLYAYRKKEIVVEKDLEPKAKDEAKKDDEKKDDAKKE